MNGWRLPLWLLDSGFLLIGELADPFLLFKAFPRREVLVRGPVFRRAIDSRGAIGVLVAEYLRLLTRLLRIHPGQLTCLRRQLLAGQGLGLLNLLLSDVQGDLIFLDLFERVWSHGIPLLAGLQEAGIFREQDEGDAPVFRGDHEVHDLPDLFLLLIDDDRVPQIAGEVGLLLLWGLLLSGRALLSGLLPRLLLGDTLLPLLELAIDLGREALGLLLSLLLTGTGLGHGLLDLLFNLLPFGLFLGQALGEGPGFLLGFLLLDSRLRHGLLQLLLNLLDLLLLTLLAGLALLRSAELLLPLLLELLVNLLCKLLRLLLSLLLAYSSLAQGILDFLFDLLLLRLFP